ncbi:MAG: F0F1 ATP synthase subunit delta [Pseudomonadota bacterium]|nr:F0F1 ATP synthase subunit delta [Pseudomonadota bacterium]
MAEAATIARPYAKAAFMAARDAKALPAWSKALHLSAGLIGDPSIADLLTHPKMTVDQLVSMFAGLGGDPVDAQWQNFVRLLARNKRLGVLPQIAAQYEILRAQYENELDVQVTSAVAMNADQQGKLANALKKRFKRDVRLTLGVDPNLLGGAVIRAGDLVIDGSINGRLQRLASELAG